MTDMTSTSIILIGVGVPFAASCYSVMRVSYFDHHSKADLLLSFYRVVVFAGALVGCLAVSEMYGDAASAAFAALVCVGSFAVGGVLSRSWRANDAAELDRMAELRSLVEHYRTAEDSLESRCSRAAREHDLTRREEEILALLLKGRTRAEIARELYVSAGTVKTHVRNLYRKTGVAGKDELVRFLEGSAGGAVEEG